MVATGGGDLQRATHRSLSLHLGQVGRPGRPRGPAGLGSREELFVRQVLDHAPEIGGDADVQGAIQQRRLGLVRAGDDGLTDAAVEGAFAWVDGAGLTYDLWQSEGFDLDLDGQPLPEVYIPEGLIYTLPYDTPSECFIEGVGDDIA